MVAGLCHVVVTRKCAEVTICRILCGDLSHSPRETTTNVLRKPAALFGEKSVVGLCGEGERLSPVCRAFAFTPCQAKVNKKERLHVSYYCISPRLRHTQHAKVNVVISSFCPPILHAHILHIHLQVKICFLYFLTLILTCV